jgi:hypothetical protein
MTEAAIRARLLAREVYRRTDVVVLHKAEHEPAVAAVEVLGHRVEISAAALRAALDPRAAVSARAVAGGAAPESMDAMIAECERALAKADAWTRQHRGRLRMAEDSLLRTAHECLRGSAASSPA